MKGGHGCGYGLMVEAVLCCLEFVVMCFSGSGDPSPIALCFQKWTSGTVARVESHSESK